MNILIADDDRVLAAALSAHFTKAGMHVDVAFDAMQAVMMATRIHADLIVLDISMPGGTGFDVLRRLKTNVRTMLIPVLVLTGSAEPIAARQRALEMGAAGFMTKSSDHAAITQTVMQLIAQAMPAPVQAGGGR